MLSELVPLYKIYVENTVVNDMCVASYHLHYTFMHMQTNSETSTLAHLHNVADCTNLQIGSTVILPRNFFTIKILPYYLKKNVSPYY